MSLKWSEGLWQSAEFATGVGYYVSSTQTVNADPIEEKSKNLTIALTLVQSLVSIKYEEPSGLAKWLVWIRRRVTKYYDAKSRTICFQLAPTTHKYIFDGTESVTLIGRHTENRFV